MTITINGNGTVTGISAGGLPDNIITNAEMADDSVGIADLSATGTASASTFLRGDNSWAAVTTGITEADMWRIHSETAGGNSPQTTNWERADTGGFGVLGSGLSESSGVFTFPSTGYWYIQLTVMARHNADSSAIWARIDQTSNNGGSWGHYAVGTGNINYVSGSWWYGGATCQHMFDITDTSNQKVRFHMSANDSAYIEANSGQQCTGFVALKLADT